MGAVRNQLKKEGLSKKTIDVIADALEAQGEFTSLGWVDVASATITNIVAANSPNVRITGTNTITGLGTAASGTKITARFADALTFTHNGTSLILPGAANITTAANDTADMVSLGSGNWICTSYKKASGAAVVVAGGMPYKKIVGLAKINNADNSVSLTVYENDTVYSSPSTVYQGDGWFDVYVDGNPSSSLNIHDSYHVVVFANPMQPESGEMQLARVLNITWKTNGFSVEFLRHTVSGGVLESAVDYRSSFVFELRLYPI